MAGGWISVGCKLGTLCLSTRVAVLNWLGQRRETKGVVLGEGSTKFLIGTAVGAAGGFAVGVFAATPAARSAGQYALGGLEVSARFLGRTIVRAVDGLGSVLESGYTRVRGREAYLEHEIQELREQITRLEQRMD
jgi:hypothetical protein